MPQYKDFVYPFYKDKVPSVIRMAHPYLTTNEMYHRHFGEDELAHYEYLNKLQASNKVGP